MAQGTIKSRKPTTSSSKKSANPKKGARTIAPKKKNLVKQNKITKVDALPFSLMSSVRMMAGADLKRLEIYSRADWEDGKGAGGEGGTFGDVGGWEEEG